MKYISFTVQRAKSQLRRRAHLGGFLWIPRIFRHHDTMSQCQRPFLAQSPAAPYVELVRHPYIASQGANSVHCTHAPQLGWVKLPTPATSWLGIAPWQPMDLIGLRPTLSTRTSAWGNKQCTKHSEHRVSCLQVVLGLERQIPLVKTAVSSCYWSHPGSRFALGVFQASTHTQTLKHRPWKVSSQDPHQ